MLAALRHHVAAGFKRLYYGRRGEPYHIPGQTLRYLPGTRPVRLRYIGSDNAVVRYDALQVQLLSTQLNEGDTAIDIGAHHGVYSVIMAARCGYSGKVVAFEPDPYARAVLQKNVALNPSIKPPVVEACACSDTIGEVTLYSRCGNSQSSLARSAVEFQDAQSSEEIRVPVVTLDSYLQRHTLNPRWIKIDAEGAEIRILQGATQTLAGGGNIVCELHPYAWPEFGNSFGQLKQIAEAAGRRIRYLGQSADVGEQAEYGTVILTR